MKIRTDFVTNSSSSSFCVEVGVHDVKGRVYSIEVCPADPEQGGEVMFAAQLEQATGCTSVAELCEFLMAAIRGEFCDSSGGGDYGFDEEEADEGFDDVGAMKTAFTNEVGSGVGGLEHVAKIVVTREYKAHGEFAELVADSDEKLLELAKNVVKSKGKAAEAARAYMLEYIHTSDGSRAHDFGSGFEDFRYSWSGDDAALVMLAKRLCSNKGPGFVQGIEHMEVDMKTGKVTKYAEFELE